MLQAMAPHAETLERKAASRLRRFSRDATEAILSILPTAAARSASLDSFFVQVERRGREMARRGVAPEHATAALREFDARLAEASEGRYEPAREQLQLATTFALYRAFYASREEEVRRLESLAWRAEELERRRIGRELHDEAGQSLVLLRLQLEMLERRASSDLRAGLAEARGTVERVVEELRRIVAALSPAVLERLGLAAAIRQMAARLAKASGIRARVRVRGEDSGLPMEAQEVVYRVAQESFQNAVKHSGATEVKLSLEITDMDIRLRVSDNGAGFSVETARSRPLSFGLTGMRERAELLGGALTVRSAPGKGAAIVLRLPVSPKVTPDGKNSRISD
jgi:two-component system sensor histidine kinase UhpB